MTGGQVSLDGRPVLRGIDLTVAAGEVVAVLGANGSGKSTLVRALLGLIPLSGGTTQLYGIAARAGSATGGASATCRSGCPSAAACPPPSARSSPPGGSPASAGCGRRARPTGRRSPGAGGRRAWPTGPATRCSALSGGQQQRVLIARALAGEPDTFVMDEPTAGVDADEPAGVSPTRWPHWSAQGKTVLLVAHELGPLEPLITRAVVLRDGRIVARRAAARAAVGLHALPGHDHVHPHAADGPTRAR